MNGLFRLATALTEFVWKVIDFFGGALTTGTARSWGEGVPPAIQKSRPGFGEERTYHRPTLLNSWWHLVLEQNLLIPPNKPCEA
jgi:hypothetical protein